ncbi:MAG: hypothetical protein ABFD92_12435 [Planctomycetaceae bacterium]|nr:hypothetical protein [Planctomycetaceae bacterium]
MGKFILRALLIAVVLLVASFAVVRHEGKVDAFWENRWTARRDAYDKPLQYVLLSNPGPTNKVVAYERRHFGWPMPVLYVDSPATDGTLAANFVAACVPALAVAIILAIRRRRSESSPDATQTETKRRHTGGLGA